MLVSRPRLSRYGVFALVAIGLALAARAQDWKTFRYPADGFSASFPVEPEPSSKSVPTDAGTFELRSYMTQDDRAALFIGVCDYGPATSGSDPDKQLQGAKNGALVNSNAHLTRETRMALGAFPGIEFESESTTAHFRARMYMVGTTLYQILVVTKIGRPYPDTLRFLDSFQLIARGRA